MRVTVLGKSPSWQDADGACSGYLVQDGETTLLLDCGNGAFAKLRRFHDYAAVDAVLLSHLHADHFLDLVPYAYALQHGPRGQGGAVRPALHAPPGAEATFRRVVGAWGSEDLLTTAFELREYDPAEPLEIGTLHVRFRSVPHFVSTHACELTSAGGGGRFVFGADSGPSDALVDLARDAELLMVEATLPEPPSEDGEDEERGHLSPAEAGEHARRAGVRRLVLTHLSDELDLEAMRSAAADAFGSPVDLAAEGAVYEL